MGSVAAMLVRPHDRRAGTLRGRSGTSRHMRRRRGGRCRFCARGQKI